MSGHSKWATIKRKKEATDSKRSNMYAKLLRAVEVATALKASTDSAASASGSAGLPPGLPAGAPVFVAPPGAVPPTDGLH